MFLALNKLGKEAPAINIRLAAASIFDRPNYKVNILFAEGTSSDIRR